MASDTVRECPNCGVIVLVDSPFQESTTVWHCCDEYFWKLETVGSTNMEADNDEG